MLPFDFGSTLIIKIILIARQPIILQYCSCESYILITFLITLKKPLSSPFAPNMLQYWKEGLIFLNCYFRMTSTYTNTITSICTETQTVLDVALLPYTAT